MELVWPTIIIAGLTVLIVWGGFALVAHLERMSGGGYGHDARYKSADKVPPQPTAPEPAERPGQPR